MLLERKVAGVAYETITAANGSLPLLTPMSEVAGRMSVHVGAYYLQKSNGGRGVLLSGVPGVPPADVVIIGGGVVGTNAAKIAAGMGADVTILEMSPDRMRELDDIFLGRVKTVASNPMTLEEGCRRADLLIGAVLIPGAAAPKLVTRAAHLADEEGLGRRRRRRRPGRLLRDDARDDALRSRLHGRRRHPLLRREHAGRRRAHLDLRADELDAPLRAASSPTRA